MKRRIRRSQLQRTFCAIALWLFSGSKVLYMGLQSYDKSGDSTVALLWFVGAFVFFSFLVFPRAIPPNVRYIHERAEVLPLYHCIRPRTWLISFCMMSLGITLRLSNIVSAEFIFGFYSALGLSLLACTLYYIKSLRDFLSETNQA